MNEELLLKSFALGGLIGLAGIGLVIGLLIWLVVHFLLKKNFGFPACLGIGMVLSIISWLLF